MRSSSAAPAAALVFNAFVWGVSWWPFRQLQSQGLHPLWTTALVYALPVLALTLWRANLWRELWRYRALWVVMLGSGATNAAFNWGVTVGDVVRVVLLFYLMPLWSLLLAWLVLHEQPTRGSAVRVAMALTGALLVLSPPGRIGLPVPQGITDLLGIVGGFAFALNNVMLKRTAARSDGARALAMFTGGALVSSVLALLLPDVALPPAPQLHWVMGALALGCAFLLSNLALQYAATRLPAHTTAVIMLVEVVFASGTSVLMGAGALSTGVLLGGALIVGAAVLAAAGARSPQTPGTTAEHS